MLRPQCLIFINIIFQDLSDLKVRLGKVRLRPNFYYFYFFQDLSDLKRETLSRLYEQLLGLCNATFSADEVSKI